MAWFRRKRFGYGWTPSSWEGWLATLLFVLACIAVGDPRLMHLDKMTRLICVVALVACLSAVAAATCERDPKT